MKTASTAISVLEAATGTFKADNGYSSGTNTAKAFVGTLEAAKTALKKNSMQSELIRKVRELGQKYCRDDLGLEDIKEFMSKASKVQMGSKIGPKAVTYLYELVNKQLIIRIDRLITSLKKEYRI